VYIVNILIADDHPLFAEGLKNLISAEGFNIVGIVEDGKKAYKMAVIKKPDVILMDIKMPSLNGIEATRKIKSELKDTKIIILTSFEEEDSLLKAIKAGASGYLLKSLDGEELIDSLKEIKRGKNPFSPGLEDLVLNEIRDSDVQSQSVEQESRIELTQRQLEIAKLVSRGLKYKEIAEELFLSERTIKYHMKQIKESLSLNSQAQVISYVKKYYG